MGANYADDLASFANTPAKTLASMLTQIKQSSCLFNKMIHLYIEWQAT